MARSAPDLRNTDRQVHHRSRGAPLAGRDPTASAAGISTSCVRAGGERRATACATRTRGSMVGGCGAC